MWLLFVSEAVVASWRRFFFPKNWKKKVKIFIEASEEEKLNEKSCNVDRLFSAHTKHSFSSKWLSLLLLLPSPARSNGTICFIAISIWWSRTHFNTFWIDIVSRASSSSFFLAGQSLLLGCRIDAVWLIAKADLRVNRNKIISRAFRVINKYDDGIVTKRK